MPQTVCLNMHDQYEHDATEKLRAICYTAYRPQLRDETAKLK